MALRRPLDRRRLRRVGLLIGLTGGAFVIAAIPSNSRALVATGLILVVIGHALILVSYVRRYDRKLPPIA